MHVLLLTALSQFNAKYPKGLQRTRDHLTRRMERTPESKRLMRFAKVIDTLRAMQAKKVADAMRMVRELTQEVDNPDMDMEAGCNAVALGARLNSQEIELE